MSLPTVNIPRQNGQLKRTQPSDDAVVCFVISGAAVANGVQLGTANQIYGTAQLESLLIDADNNPLAYAEIIDYYAKVGEGAELNFMLVSDATLLADICDKAQQIGKKLLDSTAGRGVIFLVSKKLPAVYVSNLQNGMEKDVWDGIEKLNELAKQYDDNNIPFVGVLPGIGFNKNQVAALASRTTLTFDYVAASLACKANDGIISMGMLAGVIANRQVNRNVARVADGAVADDAYFPDGTPVLDPAIIDSLGDIHDKGYIFLRKIGDKAGYYFNDDPTLTNPAGDFTSISWNRVINKAKRIAHGIIIEKLMDDVETNPDTGLIESSLASDWESDVENAIKDSMMKASATKVKEISGVKCSVDPNSDITNDEVDLSLEIVRKGQAKTINMSISYAASV